MLNKILVLLFKMQHVLVILVSLFFSGICFIWGGKQLILEVQGLGDENNLKYLFYGIGAGLLCLGFVFYLIKEYMEVKALERLVDRIEPSFAKECDVRSIEIKEQKRLMAVAKSEREAEKIKQKQLKEAELKRQELKKEELRKIKKEEQLEKIKTLASQSAFVIVVVFIIWFILFKEESKGTGQYHLYQQNSKGDLKLIRKYHRRIDCLMDARHPSRHCI